MTQHERILWQMERLGGRITTFELMELRIGQYQARLKELREKLSIKGWTLTEAEPIQGQRKNFMYRLFKQGTLF